MSRKDRAAKAELRAQECTDQLMLLVNEFMQEVEHLRAALAKAGVEVEDA